MELQEIGRIAFRVEGDVWNAYWVPQQDNMTGARILGSIRMSAVLNRSDRKAAFMDLMEQAFADVVEDAVGERPSFEEPQVAPESERAGHA